MQRTLFENSVGSEVFPHFPAQKQLNWVGANVFVSFGGIDVLDWETLTFSARNKIIYIIILTVRPFCQIADIIILGN